MTKHNKGRGGTIYLKTCISMFMRFIYFEKLSCRQLVDFAVCYDCGWCAHREVAKQFLMAFTNTHGGKEV